MESLFSFVKADGNLSCAICFSCWIVSACVSRSDKTELGGLFGRGVEFAEHFVTAIARRVSRRRKIFIVDRFYSELISWMNQSVNNSK